MKAVVGAVVRKVTELVARLPLSSRKCVICGHRLARFLPYRGGIHGLPRLMRVLNVVGSDVENFSCPWCHSHDRERHLFLYLKASGLLSFIKGKRVLHFAPEMHLFPFIEEAEPDVLIGCDLHPWTPGMVKVDLMALPYTDGYFDLLIANHVLEHVEDDRLAVAEIARVLKPGGYAILQTPYSEVLERTWEDPGIRSGQARLEAFGQEDHVRLFGKDIFDRFAQRGLESEVQLHDELLSDYCPQVFGLNKREPFFLFKRLVADDQENIPGL